jgi:hypothetical protein
MHATAANSSEKHFYSVSLHNEKDYTMFDMHTGGRKAIPRNRENYHLKQDIIVWPFTPKKKTVKFSASQLFT